VCCSVLQCVAVCCSVLQCVAVCCSVLQCQFYSHTDVCDSVQKNSRFQRAFQSKFEFAPSPFGFVLKILVCKVPSSTILILIKGRFILPKLWHLVVLWTCRILPKGLKFVENFPPTDVPRDSVRLIEFAGFRWLIEWNLKQEKPRNLSFSIWWIVEV